MIARFRKQRAVSVMKAPNVPNGFILFSEAIRRLQISMWGGFPRPIESRRLRERLRKEGEHEVRVGFGPWRQRAGECLTQAALNGKLRVYLAHQDQDTPVCTIIPSNVLGRLITSRGSLPDQPIRPSIKACEGDENLFLLLKTGCLVVAESKFNDWREAEYSRGKWPSQRSRSKHGDGRPTKQTDPLRKEVLALVGDDVWNGRQPITRLQNLLIASGRDNVPSTDTLARLVDNLHGEIGHPDLHRVKRVRRKRSK
jgi:hypothetical protein